MLIMSLVRLLAYYLLSRKQYGMHVLLIIVRCPAGSRFLRSPEQNFVHPSPEQLNVLQTGFIPAFLLGVGNTVHVHCTVKICLVGNEADCTLVSNIPKDSLLW